MPRASSAPNNLGLERAKQKLKLQKQREEIDKLKRSGKAKDDIITRLQKANIISLEPEPRRSD
jgi:hypothetical protein